MKRLTRIAPTCAAASCDNVSNDPGEAGPPASAELPATRGRLLRLEISCPRCGSRPAMRVTQELASALRGEPEATRIATYQCQRRGCGTIYDLPVRAIQSEG